MEDITINNLNSISRQQLNDKKSRINSIDIAKAIGIFFIVLGHVLEFGELRKFIYAFHVPLFFFLSGLCFSRKENLTFVKKKILSIYVPYVIISIISIAIYATFGKFIGASNVNIIDNIKGMLYANPNLGNMQWNQPLWFLPSLMIQLILINFFENFIFNLKHKKYIRTLMLICLCVLGYVLSFYKIHLPFQLEAALCMLIFTYAGIFIKNNREKLTNNQLISKIIDKKYLIIVLLIASLVISVILERNNSTVSVMLDNYGNYFIYIVVNILMIFNIMLLSNLIDKALKKQRIISFIGQNTLIILLIHKFPILFFQKVCPFIKDILNKNDTVLNNLMGILISLIVIAMCIILKYFINLIVLRRNKNDTN